MQQHLAGRIKVEREKEDEENGERCKKNLHLIERRLCILLLLNSCVRIFL